MPKSPDEELQATILNESNELSARKQKLENDIMKLDAVNKSIQEAAAVRDIEAYKTQRLCRNWLRVNVLSIELRIR